MGEAQKYLRGTRLMPILPHKIGISKRILTSRAGLIVVAQLMQRLGLEQLADRQLPVAGSNRGYRQGAMFNIFMLLFHEGGKCLDDVSHLQKEKPLMKLLGCGKLPGAKTLGNWLRRVGRSCQAMQGLVNINKTILAAGLYNRTQITLDIDATVIESNKRTARYTYKKHRGYTPMVGHIAETDQVVAVEFREGNESPNKENLQFIQRCESALPEGVSVSDVRIDAAGYQAAVINYAMDNGMGFAIRAKMDSAVKETISEIKDCEWRPLVCRDGSESDTEQVCRTLHVMTKTEAFTLIVQRKHIDDDDNSQLDILINSDDETGVRGRNIYRAIATNKDELSDPEVVHFYNQRGESSENRIKELRSDFAAARLPCGDFHANAAWLMLSSMAYNLFALMRMVLPHSLSTARAPTVRLRLYDVAALIVRHARQWTVKVNACHRKVMDEALDHIRGFPLLL